MLLTTGRAANGNTLFDGVEVAGSGQTAPLETRRATIRRILFNLRQAEVIRSHEEELVDAALTEGEAKIYGHRNN